MPPPPEPFDTQVEGVVAFPTVVYGATVTAYEVSGGAKGAMLASATTNADGEYDLLIQNYRGPLVLETTGGMYEHPVSRTTESVSMSLLGIIAEVGSTTNVAAMITPLTTLGARMAESIVAGYTVQTITDALAAMNRLAAGLLSASGTPVINVLATGVFPSIEVERHSLLLAGLAQLAENNGLTMVALMTRMINDGLDGKMDGRNPLDQLITPDAAFGYHWGVATKQFQDSLNNEIGADGGRTLYELIPLVDPDIVGSTLQGLDGKPPRIERLTPRRDALDPVPTDSDIWLEFTESVDLSALQPDDVILRDGDDEIGFTLVEDPLRKSVRLELDAELPPNTLVDLGFRGYRDLHGNLGAPYTATLFTDSGPSPMSSFHVTSATPAPGAAVRGKHGLFFLLTFTEPIRPDDANMAGIVLENTVTMDFYEVFIYVAEDPRVLRIQPIEELPPGSYAITIPSSFGSTTDKTIGMAHGHAFTVSGAAPNVAPVILDASVADGGTIDPRERLRIEFSEPIDALNSGLNEIIEEQPGDLPVPGEVQYDARRGIGTVINLLPLNAEKDHDLEVPTTIQDTDGSNPAAPFLRSFFTIPQPLVVVTLTLPAGAQGAGYATTVDTMGGGDPPTFSLRLGDMLPAGLMLDPNTGTISGTPLAAGMTTFGLVVTSGFDIRVREFTLVVN